MGCLRCGAQPYHEGQPCGGIVARSSAPTADDDGESSLLRWMEETGTKQCPNCKIPVSKENLHNQETQRSECHKMWCRNCGTRFCFKCLLVLTRKQSCKCTKDIHSFIDPHTGNLVKGFGKKK